MVSATPHSGAGQELLFKILEGDYFRFGDFSECREAEVVLAALSEETERTKRPERASFGPAIDC